MIYIQVTLTLQSLWNYSNYGITITLAWKIVFRVVGLSVLHV